MIGRFTQTLVAAVLVVAMAGAAVAFAVGVPFAPRASCPNPGYGSTCPGKKPGKPSHIHVSGPGIHGKHLGFVFRNNNHVTVHIKLVIRLVSGKGRHAHHLTITKVFKLKPGQTFRLNRQLAFKKFHGTLTLTITGATGGHATITRRF
jgi:hypothetical protein